MTNSTINHDLPQPRSRWPWLLPGLLIVLLTLVAYKPLRNNGFIYFDDNVYVTANPHVQQGITAESLQWAFTSPGYANWHPLTWLSHMLDIELFGWDPANPQAGPQHLVSLAFHILNAILLLIVLHGMTGSRRRSALVAALFALHPIRVESVAWVSERKDLLSGLLFMLTLLAYLGYTRKGGLLRYLLVVGCYILGLMSKPMLVTLPVILLLIDYWPLERIGTGDREKASPSEAGGKEKGGMRQHTNRPVGIKTAFLEKLPLFALAAISSLITIRYQQYTPAMAVGMAHSFVDRLANAFQSVAVYLYKTVVPIRLGIFYPWPENTSLVAPLTLLGLGGLVGGTVLAIRLRKSHKNIIIGWLWFLVMLLPVLGLLKVGRQALADRYMYLPGIGVLVMVAWLLPSPPRLALVAGGAVAGSRRFRMMPAVVPGTMIAAVVAVVIILAGLTHRQASRWRGTIPLFEHTLSVAYPNPVIETNLAVAYLNDGQVGRAVDHLTRVLEHDPEWINALNNLAWIRAAWYAPEYRDLDEALRLIQRACTLAGEKRPALLDTLGVVYANRGDFRRGTMAAREALRLAREQGKTGMAMQISHHLSFIAQQQPYYQPPPTPVDSAEKGPAE